MAERVDRCCIAGFNTLETGAIICSNVSNIRIFRVPGTPGIVIRVLVHHLLHREHYLPVVFFLGMFFRLFFIDFFSWKFCGN